MCGMTSLTRRLIDADKKHLWHPFTQMAGWLRDDPVIIDSAEGFHLRDTEGNRYIDGISSLWCNVHGHRVAAIDEAVRRQLDLVAHSTLLGLGQTRSIELAERLVSLAPPGLSRVFYSDSGASAVEIALKMAYQYFYNKGRRNRGKFVALSSGYHGDTIGSVSLGGIETFHSIFRPLLFETFFAPSPHPYRFDGTAEQCAARSLEKIEEILGRRADEIAAVIMEPLVQGAGGVIVHPPGFFSAVRDITKKYGVLLIADEVATGFGRTGRMFACGHENVRPDIMCLAKGLSGGYLPLAATLATEQVFEAFLGRPAEHKTFYHGHTYTGNALGCAAALASLDLFEKNNILESLPAKSDLLGRYFNRMGRCRFVGNARRRGLMGAIELVADKKTKEPFPFDRLIGAKICLAMRPRGVMLRPLGDCVIVMPPPAMDTELLEKMLEVILACIEEDLPGVVSAAS